MVFKVIVCAVLAYFIGTIQTAILISRGIAKKDVRDYGSGNAGSTNMVRTFGWGLGALTFLGDVAKGALVSLVCGWIGGDVCVLFGGIFVIVGHVFPVQYGFKGGKGVASTFGIMLAINPLVALITFVVCFLVAIITRFVSVGSLLGALAFFIASLFMGRGLIILLFAILLLFILFTHRSNISRLIKGTENPFFGKRKGELDGVAQRADSSPGRGLK